MSAQGSTWMVEVLGDGTGARHRRFLVEAPDRDSAVNAVIFLLGADVVITASTKLSDNAAEVAALQAGEVRQI
jgi:hypothetical protein